MKKKLLAVAMGAMLAAGAANAVTVNHVGLGDLLVAPSYFIGGGWQAEVVRHEPGAAAAVDGQVVVRDAGGRQLGWIARVDLGPGDAWANALRAELPPTASAKPQWLTPRRV